MFIMQFSEIIILKRFCDKSDVLTYIYHNHIL